MCVRQNTNSGDRSQAAYFDFKESVSICSQTSTAHAVETTALHIQFSLSSRQSAGTRRHVKSCFSCTVENRRYRVPRGTRSINGRGTAARTGHGRLTADGRPAAAEDTEYQQLNQQITAGWPDSPAALPADLRPYELTVSGGVVFKGHRVVVPRRATDDFTPDTSALTAASGGHEKQYFSSA